MHNVDVLSRIPLNELLVAHRAAKVRAAGRLVASVTVQARTANRRLLFDSRGLLGCENRAADGTVLGSERVRTPVGALRHWSFTGIHVLEPNVFDLSPGRDNFSIVTWYLDLAQRGYAILPIDVSDHEWIDVGTHAGLEEARAREWGSEDGMRRLE